MNKTWPDQNGFQLIRLTQYLAGLTIRQNEWGEIGKALISFFDADLVAFGKKDADGNIIVHDLTFPDPQPAPDPPFEKTSAGAVERLGPTTGLTIKEGIAETLQSGFFASRLLADPMALSITFLPFTQNNHVAGVMLVGYRKCETFPRDLLNLFMAIAGLVGTITSRLNMERELYNHRRHLESLVKERTAALTKTNAQLVTEAGLRRQADAALIESERRFQKMLGVVPDMIAILNPEMDILYSNWQGLAAVPENKRILNTKCYKTYQERDEICPACLATSVLETGKPIQEEIRLPDGTWVDMRTIPFLDKNNNVEMFMEWVRDITAQKQTEAKLRYLQKSESLGRMAGAVAHHFNNQLGVVMGNLELVLDDLPGEAVNRENLIAAMEAARKAADISLQMLSYLGQTAGQQTPIDLSAVCSQSLSFFQSATRKGTPVNADFPDAKIFVRADAVQIQQVLTNLLTNAQESVSDNQGAIGLGIRTVSQKDIPASNRFPLDWQPQDILYACLAVSDTGCGIPGKNIEKLFDPFFSTKFTGRGMGLAVTMGIVKNHGGCITVDSEPGSGSVFRVYLPLSMEKITFPLEPEKPAAVPARKVENGGTVLLIDDEEMIRKMAKTMLSRLGYKVLEAQDGVEAMAIFQQHQNDIVCVLSDLTMPRMNGWETLTALRQMGAGVPVIMASGYDRDTVMAGKHPELPQAFLNKPYSMAALKDALLKVMQVSKFG